jgi:putative ABC transport system ATP-binding protein
MTDSPLIQLTNIEKTYTLGGVKATVLKKVSLTINSGSLVAIVGASGSGKSTLMHIMGLLDQDYTGSYSLDNRNADNLTTDNAALLRNQCIGFVFQQFNLLPRLTAAQNVALPLTYRGLDAQAIAERVSQVLQKVGMQAYGEHKPLQLSGGQQQRIAIARALITEPQVILADEPTGSLDSKTGAEVMALFLSLHAEGRTLILVTHDNQIASQCKRRVVLADGALLAD